MEQAVKKNLDDKAEAGGKKTAKELAEAAAKKKGPPGKVVTRSLDDKVDDAIDAFDPSTATSTQKGNFGEMVTDRDMINNGYEALHSRLDDLDTPTHQGIDGVFRHPGPPPRYVVVDAKYGQAGLNTLSDGTRQMSNPWINDRLSNAVGGDRNILRDININGYERVVAKVDDAGNIVYRRVDADGYIIRGNAGNWP
ncbi:MAG: hypothetical protein ACK5IC_06160 [Moheibacter sp.]